MRLPATPGQASEMAYKLVRDLSNALETMRASGHPATQVLVHPLEEDWGRTVADAFRLELRMDPYCPRRQLFLKGAWPEDAGFLP